MGIHQDTFVPLYHLFKEANSFPHSVQSYEQVNAKPLRDAFQIRYQGLKRF